MVVSYNHCGECNACCSTTVLKSYDMEWRDTDKCRNELCDQWSDGCAIHNKKPQACIEYECLWLKIKKGREEYTEARRPNEIGFMISIKTTNDGTLRFVVDEVQPNSFDLENMTTEQSNFLDEILYLASAQKEEVKVAWRSFDGEKILELDYLVETTLEWNKEKNETPVLDKKSLKRGI